MKGTESGQHALPSTFAQRAWRILSHTSNHNFGGGLTRPRKMGVVGRMYF